MKRFVSLLLAILSLVLFVGSGYASERALVNDESSTRATRDPNNVKSLTYTGTGTTNATMSAALQAPSNGKIRISFSGCQFVGSSTGTPHTTKFPSKVKVWVERYKNTTGVWVSEVSKKDVTISNGSGYIDLDITKSCIFSVHFEAQGVPNGYTFKYTRSVSSR